VENEGSKFYGIGCIVLFSLYVPFVCPINKFMCIEAMQAQIVSG
jgi:hypothetical protein